MDYKELIENLNQYSAEHQNHGGISARAADAITDLLARAEKAEKIVDEYAESARAISLWLTAFCDRTLSYPSMISNAARKVSLAYADMERRIETVETRCKLAEKCFDDSALHACKTQLELEKKARSEAAEARAEKAERERDAAVEDLREMCVGGNTCAFCKHGRNCGKQGPGRKTVESCWEWRGQKEE